MCRIAGQVIKQAGTTEKTEKAPVIEMGRAMQNGGPDDRGTIVSGAATINHQRLAIIAPGPEGAQPFVLGEAALSYNGEVYNFRELRQELSSDYNFQGNSDTEVVFAALRVWGNSALNRFKGMWALAYWDGAKHELLLARDERGIKPLYYANLPEKLLFASELKGIMVHPDCPREIDTSSVRAFLRRGYIPAPQSIYRQVRKLMPGQWLTCNAQSSEVKLGFHSTFNKPAALQVNGTDPVEELRHRFGRSCERRMIADVPVGVLLSGGIDSSLIAATLQSTREERIPTYTMGFSETAFDEAPRAAAIARHLNTDHHEVHCSAADFRSAVPEMSRVFCEPFGDASGIATWLLGRGVSKDLKCCLGGEGGDEVFGGYTKYRASLAFSQNIGLLPVGIRKVLAKGMRKIGPSNIARLIGRFGYSPPNVEDQLYKMSNSLAAASSRDFFQQASSYAGPEVLKRLGFGQPRQSARWESPNLLLEMSVADINDFLVDDLLVKTDRASMDHGLEVRLPFLDEEVVNYGLSLPTGQKINGGKNKVILRKLLSRYLPENLMDKGKRGFAIPLDLWLRNELKDELRTIAEDQAFADCFQLSFRGLAGVITDFFSGERYVNAYPVWFIYVLHAWYTEWHR